MATKKQLASLQKYFGDGDFVELTETQYREATGCALPKKVHYIKSGSSFAKYAEERGYQVFDVVSIVERKVILKRMER